MVDSILNFVKSHFRVKEGFFMAQTELTGWNE